MAVNVLELVTNSPEFDVTNFFELEDADLKWKLYNMLISSLGAHSTKTNALHRLSSLLAVEERESLGEAGPKLFSALNKIINKASETPGNKRAAAQCLAHIIRISHDGSDFQKEVATSVPSLITALLKLENVRAWEPLLVQLMEHYPGPCGPLRGQVWTKLCGLVGSAQLTRRDLGRIFSLFPSLGGGGREGIEHTRAFAQTFQTVRNTTNTILNNLFTYLKEYEPGRVGRDVMPLDSGLLEHNKQAKDVQQLLDLIEIECSMLTLPFPQVREVRVDDVLGDVTRLLAVSDGQLAASGVPEHQVVRLLLPSLHVAALQLLQCLILSVGDDLIPEVATINNLILKSLAGTAKSPKTREALYATMAVYVGSLGACTGMEHCLDRIIPYLAGDFTPHQDKILLVPTKRRHGGPKRKKGKQNDYEAPTIKKVNLNLKLCRAALKFTEDLLAQLGCLMEGQRFRDLSSSLLNLALHNQITDEEALISLYGCLGGLCNAGNPRFKSPLRLCLHILQRATVHKNPEVARTAKHVLSSLTTLIHPQCPPLEIRIMDEVEMRKIVAKLLRDQEEQEKQGGAMEQEARTNSSAINGFFGSSKNSTTQQALSQNSISSLAEPTPKINGSQEEGMETIPSQPRETTVTEASLAITDKDSKLPDNKQSAATPSSSGKARQIEDVATKYVAKNPPKKSIAASSSGGLSADTDETDDHGRLAVEKEKPLKRKLDEDQEDLSENVEKLTTNLQEIESKKVRKESTTETGQELDVETMLKDFSDKLNENLVPDPWDDDTDEQDDDN